MTGYVVLGFVVVMLLAFGDFMSQTNVCINCGKDFKGGLSGYCSTGCKAAHRETRSERRSLSGILKRAARKALRMQGGQDE